MHLKEIADRAAASGTSTVDLLRQLKIVAARAKLPPLADWVNHELGGYPEGAALPVYRGPFEVPVFGKLVGPFNSGVDNLAIPPAAFEDGMAALFSIEFRDGVASIEELTKSKEEVLRTPWPADALATYEYYLKPGVQLGNGMMNMISAHRAVGRPVLVQIVSTVRDRVLDLALELERIHPELAEGPHEKTRSAQINSVTAIIYGNAAIGSADFEQLVQMEIPTTKDALFDRLREQGIGDDALAELDQAMSEDAATTAGKARVGAKVGAWLGKHADKAVGSGVNAVGSSVGGAVSQLVLGFLGLGGS